MNQLKPAAFKISFIFLTDFPRGKLGNNETKILNAAQLKPQAL